MEFITKAGGRKFVLALVGIICAVYLQLSASLNMDFVTLILGVVTAFNVGNVFEHKESTKLNMPVETNNFESELKIDGLVTRLDQLEGDGRKLVEAVTGQGEAIKQLVKMVQK
jgi:hypothetical protein